MSSNETFLRRFRDLKMNSNMCSQAHTEKNINQFQQQQQLNQWNSMKYIFELKKYI